MEIEEEAGVEPEPVVVEEGSAGGTGGGEPGGAASRSNSRRAPLLFLTVLIIATSGLVYELLSGTVASYLLGDSVTQFSTTIGVYLFAMGIGSYLSRFIGEGVAARFVEVELAAALIGGTSAPLFFISFAHAEYFHLILYGVLSVIGMLVGLEIPLLMRILQDELDFKELVAKVLAFDYLGALLGSLGFALILVPKLGLNRTSLGVGLLNCLVAFMSTFVLAEALTATQRLRLRIKAVAVAALLVLGFVYADKLTEYGEELVYADPIIWSTQSPYQRLVITKSRNSVQLFLNGNLQFSSADEKRYHEALVHPAFAAASKRERVLVLGGGDGLALREVLKYDDVHEVVLVDLDPEVVRMAKTVPVIRDLNGSAFEDPRVSVVSDDAFVYLDSRPDDAPYDVVLIDFPDPSNFSLGKLYTRRFYRLVKRALAPGGAIGIQSTSPLYARRAFWCIDETMREAGLSTRAFHANVPAWGEWGFVLAKHEPFEQPSTLATADLRFLNAETLGAMFVFSEDMKRVPVETNRLNNQRLVSYYTREWATWN